MAEEKTIWKVVKMRYAPRYEYQGNDYRTRACTGYYVDKAETVYREHKSAVTLAVKHAEKANEYADRLRAENPDATPSYYRVEVTEVVVVEVAKGPKVYPHVAD